MTSNPNNKFLYKNWLGISLVIVGVAMFFVVDQRIVPLLSFAPFQREALNNIFRYQVVTLGITLIFLTLLFMLFKEKFCSFAHIGNMQVHPEPVKFLGIKPSDKWLGLGINFAVVVSLATGAFLFFGNLDGDITRLNLSYISIASLFALSNSFIEEAITRFGVVVTLKNVLPDRTIALISGLIFGIPHYFGTPGGPVGAVMAAFLGWLLAKSMLETKGIFWAWFIHFLQDVLIYTVIISLLPA